MWSVRLTQEAWGKVKQYFKKIEVVNYVNCWKYPVDLMTEITGKFSKVYFYGIIGLKARRSGGGVEFGEWSEEMDTLSQ